MNLHFTKCSLLLCMLFCSTCTADQRVEFFEKNIRPVLVASCYSCHSQSAASKGVLKGELRLDSRESMLRGGNSGPAIVPGKPDASLLISAIMHASLEMPPNKKLDEKVVANFETWVRSGAAFPENQAGSGDSVHWSLQPVMNPPAPKLKNDQWSQTDIDRFILEKLRTSSLTPSGDASKLRLIRRLTFDLTGLPPTEQEIDDFLGDDSGNAWESLIDRLLNSKRYGERWARHWLDIARYADTTANDGNFVMRYAYRYRDYVIEAFNEDMPFDQFILEQIAGDLMKPVSPEVDLRRRIATGFLMLGPKGLAETDKEQLRLDMADEQIDVTTRAFLGMSFSCARCHDHKFDPIPTTDYYALAGIFRGVEMLGGQSGPTSMWQETSIKYTSAKTKQRLTQLASDLKSTQQKLDLILDVVDEPQRTWEETLRKEFKNTDAAPAQLSTSVLDGLMAWYSADSIVADDKVLLWKNRVERDGAESLDLKGVPETAPSLVDSAIGKMPAVSFDENKHVLVSEAPLEISGNSPFTMFAVINPMESMHKRTQPISFGDPTTPHAGAIFEIEQTPNTKNRLDLATGHSFDALVGEVTFGEPQIWMARFHGGKLLDSHVEISGVRRELSADEFAAKAELTLKPDKIVIGGHSHPTHRSCISPKMHLGEVLIFNHALDNKQLEHVGNYLQSKYLIQGKYTGTLKDIVYTPIDERSKESAQYLRRAFLDSQKNTDYVEVIELRNDLQKQLAELEADGHHVDVMMPMEKQGINLKVHIRGDRQNLGDVVMRHTPTLFPDIESTLIDSKQSGRLELAEWIASNENHLTARVIVNRIWQWHFGKGLVHSSDNFGRIGSTPTHPKLLDYLATRFMEDGWSIKKLTKRILLSQVYQQDSTPAPDTKGDAIDTDPENTLLWSFPRRRIEAEAIRDSMLFTSGTLEDTYLGSSELVKEIYDAGDTIDRNLGLVSAANVYEVPGFAVPRRTIYLPVIRNGQNEIIATFDSADANAVTTRRNESIVATQASFLLNSEFVHTAAKGFANRLLSDSSITSLSDRIQHAYRIALGREATGDEVDAAIEFLTQYELELIKPTAENSNKKLTAEQSTELSWSAFCQFLYCLNEFIYVD